MKNDFMQDISGSREGGLAFSAMIALYFILSFTVQQIFLLFTEVNSVLYVALSSLLSVIAIILTLLFFTLLKKENGVKVPLKKSLNNYYFRNFSKIYIGLAVLLSFGMFFGMGFFNDKIADFIEGIGLKTSSFSVPMNNGGEFVLFVFLLAVLPAICEETFFRGYLLYTFKNVGFIASALISSLFFTLYHASATQIFYQFIYGVLLAILTMRSASVYPAIIAHFLNNFAVLAFSYFSISTSFLTNPLYIVIGILCLLVFCFSILAADRSVKKSKKGERTGAFLPYGIFGLLMCVIVIVLNLFL